MLVEWLEQASADRDDVEAYYGQYNLRAGVAAGDRIQECVDLFEKFPKMGRRGVVHGTREFTVPGSNCVIIYRIQGEVITIERILHGGRERLTPR